MCVVCAPVFMCVNSMGWLVGHWVGAGVGELAGEQGKWTGCWGGLVSGWRAITKKRCVLRPQRQPLSSDGVKD